MYVWANYYGAGSSSSGVADHTWFNVDKAAGTPNEQYASVSILEAAGPSNILYCSGFGISLNSLAYVASGIMTVVIRSPSGANLTSHIHAIHRGNSLEEAGSGELYSMGGHDSLPTGTTFLTKTFALNTTLVDFTDSRLKLGILVDTESDSSIDVDSIYLSLYYQERPKLYKTTSVIRTGSHFYLR